jgi:hypothetical protein
VAVSPVVPTGPVRGAVNPLAGGVAPWASFTAQTREHVPELRWPRSNVTYDRMLNDSQVFGLYTAMVLPAEAYRYWVDPNGNDAGRVAMLAEDLGLPVATDGRELDAPDLVERTSLPDEFDFADLLHEALFAPIFGHYYFEWAFDTIDGLYRLRELAPLHPATLAEVRGRRDGGLDFIRQTGGATNSLMGGVLMGAAASNIGPERLIPFVYWPDASRRWLGRSLLRPLYRNWLCKDVLIRVDVTNHERAGGVPWIETDERYQGNDLEDLQRLAAEFRVDEEGGAALPPGALLRLAKVAGSNVVDSIRYHDEQMAYVWQEMVRQLGSTANGSRALGQTLDVHEVLARREMTAWACRTINRWVIARWWLWNFGERNAPILRFMAPQLEAEVAAPPVVAPPGAGTGGGPPPRAATARPSPPHFADRAVQASEAGDDPTGGAFSRSRVPDRALRREPYEHEVAAAVDFAALEVAFEDAASALDSLFADAWLPEQIAAVTDAIVHTASGGLRASVTAAGMARLRAPVVGVSELADVLYGAAVHGAGEAVAELGAQGLALAAPTEAALRALVTDHAAAVAQQLADGVSLAASRRAVQLAASGLTPAELAAEVSAYLDGLEHAWERDQLAGAANQAVNAGRLVVFAGVEVHASAYASELLDAATCGPCLAVDGTEYADVAAARLDYPSGGYQGCRGGPRCRGTVVLRLGDETPVASTSTA